jgi:hypothetical protein
VVPPALRSAATRSHVGPPEDKLTLVLEAAEQWADEITAARVRDAQAKLDRRREWDQALPKARRAYLDQVNRDRLDRQLDTRARGRPRSSTSLTTSTPSR